MAINYSRKERLQDQVAASKHAALDKAPKIQLITTARIHAVTLDSEKCSVKESECCNRQVKYLPFSQNGTKQDNCSIDMLG